MSDKESLAYRIIWRRQEIIRINVRTGEETKHLLELVNKFVRLTHKKQSLRIVAFSDWRVQGFDALIRFIKSQPKPDVILYGGDDISRFKSGKENRFSQLSKLALHGLFAVSGNDDPPDTRKLIRGKKVFPVHSCAVIVGGYAIVGIEGSPLFPKEFGPGFNRGSLLYPEPVIARQIERWSNPKLKNKKLIIVSHTPPYGTLDFAVRFGPRHIGSRPLADFLKSSNTPIVCVCGHVHRCGQKSEMLGSTLVVNAGSHDNPGEPGRVATILISKNEPPVVQWILVGN